MNSREPGVAINPRRRSALLFALGLATAWRIAQAPALPARGLRPLDGDLAVDFACEVDMRLEVPEPEQAEYGRRLQDALLAAGLRELAPQHVLLVDRNPNVQAAFLYRLTPGGDWRLAGAVPATTGLPGQYEHFATPLGVFVHSLDNLDFRAEGTLNENGIRGYGRKGLRVFDFGWVGAPRGWGNRAMSVMRLQAHATDPEQLEGWLGKARSKGCIRIPASFDEFIDRRGVLDAEYEAAAAGGRDLWVLRPDRETTRWPGRYLVVIDSARSERPAWSPPPTGRVRRSPRPEECPPIVRP
ncbi:MAG TPA: murein L,D-transpeptidase [Usitatibacter sp.]